METDYNLISPETNFTAGPVSYESHVIDEGSPLSPKSSPSPTQENSFILVYIPALVLLGILSNTVVAIVIMGVRLRKFSHNHYLCGIAILNSVYLILLLMLWLQMLGYNIYHRPVTCHLLDGLNDLSSFLCVWLAVAFCVDRYIATCWPQQAVNMCRPYRARIVIAGLSIVAVTIYLNTSLTVGVVYVNGQPRCRTLPVPFRQSLTIRILDLFINHVLPYMVVSVLLVVIARASCKDRRDITHNIHGKLTATTLVYFVVFLIANVPAETIRISIMILDNITQTPRVTNLLQEFLYWQQLAQLITHTSMALNLYILAATHRLFRTALLEAFENYVTCKMRSRSRSPEGMQLKVANNGEFTSPERESTRVTEE